MSTTTTRPEMTEPTMDEIRNLRAEAAAAGDRAMVRLCRRAAAGEWAAGIAVARALRDASAAAK
jgi:hypothetical protein